MMMKNFWFDPAVSAGDVGGSGGVVPAAPAPAPTTSGAPTGTEPVKPVAWMEPPKPAAPAPLVPDATGAPATPPEAQPVKFTLAAPKGSSMDAAVLEKHGAEMQALGITQDQAQKILERDFQAAQARDAKNRADLVEFDKQSLNGLREAWGDKFVENSQLVKTGLDYLDPSGALRKDLERVGVAYYKPLAEAWAKVGKLLAPDRMDAPQTSSQKGGKPKPAMQRLEDSYRTTS